MIKKLFVTLLAVLYLGVSSGASLHFQYCMGRLAKVALTPDKITKCHRCGMSIKSKASKNCCSHKHQQFKSDKNQVASQTQTALLAPAVLPVVLPVWLSANVKLVAIAGHPASHAPPLKTEIPVFLRNCTFRI